MTFHRTTITTFAAAALGLALSVACDTYPEGEDPGAEACEHAVEGPAQDATAGAANDDGAPDVSAEHTRHDVALVAVDGGNGGFVRLESEGGEHIVYLTKDIPIAFFAADGAAISPEEQVVEDTCPEVVTSHHIVFPVGLVAIELGPTEETSVSLLVEPAEHEEHEE